MWDFVRCLSCNGDIVVNKVVVEFEYEYCFCNVVMVYLMKVYGNFENEVEDVFCNYFYNCVLEMSCEDLVCLMSFFVNVGFFICVNEKVLMFY